MRSRPLQASFAGDAALVVVALPNDRLVATGVVDFTRDPAYGLIMMLAVTRRFSRWVSVRS
jgi:hypothetical protein